MFIVERLIGMSVFVVILLAVCYLIARSDTRHTRFLVGIYLVCLSIMGFFYVPAIEADLFRLTEYMQTYASVSWADFMIALVDSSTPFSLLYLRAIGLLGLPGFLAGITVFIVFSNIFYILLNYGRKNKVPGRVTAFVIFAVMSTGLYMQTAGGIRSMLGFSILARCFYDELYNHKSIWKNLIWYAVACLIHPTSIVAVALRLVLLVQNKLSTRNVRPLLATLVPIAIISATVLLLGGATYLDGAADKFVSYTSEVVYTYLWDNIITILTIIFIVLNYGIYRYYRKETKSIVLDPFVIFSIIITAFSLTLVVEHAVFVRFTQLNLILMIPVIMNNVMFLKVRASQVPSGIKILYKTSFYIPFIILVVSASRGALSSLKFFELV